MILSDDVSEDDSVMVGRNAMECMWNQEKVIRLEQKRFRRLFIAEIKCMLLTNVFI